MAKLDVKKKSSDKKKSSSKISAIVKETEVLASKKAKKVEKKPVEPESSSSDSSSSESESEAEPVAPPKKESKKETKKEVKKAESSESSDSASSSDEEETKAKPVEKKAASSESESESDSDSSASESEVVTEKAAAKAASDSEDSASSSDSESEAPVVSAAKEAKTEAASEGDSSDSGSSSGSDSDAEEAAPVDKKRKQEEVAEEESNDSKKPKTEGSVEPCDVRFGNLSWGVTNETLTENLKEAGYNPTNVRVIVDKETGRAKGFAFATFETAEEASKVIADLNGAELDGRNVRVEIALAKQNNNQFGNDRPPRQNFGQRQERPKGEPTSTLFVGNLSFSVSEDSLRNAFSAHSVSSVRLPTDRETGRLKGFGYVEFGCVQEAQAAMNDLNGAEIEGRAIRLDFAGARDNNGGGGGGGGRGNFRGGRGGGRGDFRGGRGGRGARGGGRGGMSRPPMMSAKPQGKKITFD